MRHRRWALIGLLALLAGAGSAPASAASQPADEPPGVRRAYHTETGYLSFLGASPRAPIIIPGGPPNETGRAAANRALSAYAGEFGLQNAGAQLVAMREKQPGQGRSVVRYQQTYHGVPVLGGELMVNMQGNALLSINGEVSPSLDLSTQPQVSADDARSAALGVIAAYEATPADFETTEPELWIFDERLLKPSERPPELVWRMDVSSRGMVLPVRELVLINAQDGSVSLHFNQIDTFWNSLTNIYTSHSNQGPPKTSPTTTLPNPPGTADLATYSAQNTYNTTSLFLCDETAPACTSGANTHGDAAHANAFDVYDFFYTHYNRDSYNGAGGLMRSSVHYGVSVVNAYWSGSTMIYGDAYGFPLADDVAGHEFTHGVTDSESNLLYYYQSGAIDESFSDMWGEFIDQTNGRGNDSAPAKWLIGEDISGLGAIRDMEDPTAILPGCPASFRCPNKMTSSYYFTGEYDNGGVHFNSGINNKAAYLMTDGGTFNGHTVNGLGINKVAAIYYEVQTNLLTTGADYKDLHQAIYQACLTLVGGPEGITGADCDEAREATLAVEMNQEPYAGFNPSAALCPNPSDEPSSLFADDFESGIGNWTTGAFVGAPAWGWGPADYASQGDRTLRATDFNNNNDAYAELNVNVAIPPTARETYLRFDHSYDYDPGNVKGGFLEYTIDGGATWSDAGQLFSDGRSYNGTLAGASNPNLGHAAWVNVSHGFVESRFDFSNYAGRNVRIRFRLSAGIASNSSLERGWRVDHLKFYTCAPPALWVAQSNVGGPWNGTFDYPFRTINDALAVAAPGDTIKIRTGVYNEQVTVTLSNLTLLGIKGANETGICSNQHPALAIDPGVSGVRVDGLAVLSACP